MNVLISTQANTKGRLCSSPEPSLCSEPYSLLLCPMNCVCFSLLGLSAASPQFREFAGLHHDFLSLHHGLATPRGYLCDHFVCHLSSILSFVICYIVSCKPMFHVFYSWASCFRIREICPLLLILTRNVSPLLFPLAIVLPLQMCHVTRKTLAL